MSNRDLRWPIPALLPTILLLAPANYATQDSSNIPEPFAPFEHLIGAWKGQGIPTANRIKGWPERHVWAWAFEKGTPVALSIELTGNKILAGGRLSYDEASKTYRLEGSTPEKQPVTFTGKLDAAKQVLVLDRTKPLADGTTQKLTVRLNTNKIRYTVWDDQKAPGIPSAKRVTEMQMGKEGESLAGGDEVDKGPKCIVTGGKATMTVTANGKSFPVCCTGCRDEVQENPEKYEKKLALRMVEPPQSDVNKSAAGDDGALAGATKAKSKPDSKSKDFKHPKGKEKSNDQTASTVTKAKPIDKAAELFDRAQGLEKSGKTEAALVYYRMIMKDHSKSPQAKTAQERIEALGR